jgi:hypothetical protein
MKILLSVILILAVNVHCYSQQNDQTNNSAPQHIIVDDSYNGIVDSCIELNTSIIEFDSTMNEGEPDNKNGRFYLTLYQNNKLLDDNVRLRNGLSLECYATINNDTIFIEGGKGIAGGFGFIVKIYQDMFEAFYYPFSDEAIYKLKKSDKQYKRSVDVPSKSQKLILTQKPDLNKIKMVKGYVEINSANFIENGEDGVNTYRAELKVYFKCNLKVM